ncbi:hypothetical protein [Lederbergia lenta]|nr:hypothetical protein [Lederbergia lenta]
MKSEVNLDWAKKFHSLNEDQKERLWSILIEEEREIVNSYKNYR